MSIRPNLNYPENMVWSLEPLQISLGQVTNGQILFLKSSKASGLNFGAGGPYGPVRIRDICEFRLYGRPRLTASIPDIVRPDAYFGKGGGMGSVGVSVGDVKFFHFASSRD